MKKYKLSIFLCGLLTALCIDTVIANEVRSCVEQKPAGSRKGEVLFRWSYHGNEINTDFGKANNDGSLQISANREIQSMTGNDPTQGAYNAAWQITLVDAKESLYRFIYSGKCSVLKCTKVVGLEDINRIDDYFKPEEVKKRKSTKDDNPFRMDPTLGNFDCRVS